MPAGANIPPGVWPCIEKRGRLVEAWLSVLREAGAPGLDVSDRSGYGLITAVSEAPVAAPAELTYRLIADDEHHQRFLPEAITDFEVLEGGVGAETLHRFKVTAGGRTREYVMRVAEPEPGRVITETDEGSSLVTSFTVTPVGAGCTVRIETQWNGAGGVGGFFERAFAPRVMRKIYADELARLDAYAREQAGAAGS